MSKYLAHYRHLESCLRMARWAHHGEESPEEDAILDEMEDMWTKLNEGERSLLRSEGPACWPAEAAYASAPTAWAYEGFHSPADAILSAEAA